MPGIETLAVDVHNQAAGTLLAGTVGSSQSLTVRTADAGSANSLLSLWRKGTVAAPYRVRSNRMHDDVQGIRLEAGTTGPFDQLRGDIMQPIISADVLTIESSDSATTDCVIGATIAYGSIAGSMGNYATWDQIKPRILNLIGVELSVAAGGTLGQYSAGTTFNAATNLMKAGYDYAILGFAPTNNVAIVAVGGPCTGSLIFGGPGTTVYDQSIAYYKELSQESGLPTIPVMHQADAANTFAYQCDNAAGATNVVAFLCAQLAP